MDYLNTKYLDRLIELPGYIENFHQKSFKMIDIVENDIYRHMNDAGLFDYDYIERGVPAKKGGLNQPSKTNLVFAFWLMIALDLKSFGFVKKKLHKVKNYIFQEHNILENLDMEVNRDNLLQELDKFEFKNPDIKAELISKITNGSFIDALKDKSVSTLFLIIFKMLATGRDIQLYVDGTGESLFVDEFEFSKQELLDLSYDSRVVIPLKKYLLFFVGTYAELDFLTRSQILTNQEAYLLNELRRNDIISFTVKYKNGKPNTYETKKLEKIQIEARLSDVFIKGGYEDIILKTKQGQIYYSEITRKNKI